jgi:hypothetical protein
MADQAVVAVAEGVAEPLVAQQEQEFNQVSRGLVGQTALEILADQTTWIHHILAQVAAALVVQAPRAVVEELVLGVVDEIAMFLEVL